MSESPPLKEPPEGFKKTLLRLYFDNLNCLDKIVGYIEIFGKKVDLDDFFWMNPELKPTLPEMGEILNEKKYNLTEEEKKAYLKQYEAHLTRSRIAA